MQDKFKELVKSLHPDINGKNQKNEEKLKVIINAYNQLKTSGLC
ncbi:MAG: DnaJ domain-containing protein [Pseudomonadota bacterium]|nr:DnaJ domain-containing protein [Pseudomonadota bacterium]